MTPNQKASSIYVLSDPLTDEVRYVGKTEKRLNDRLCIHIAKTNRGGKTPVCNWIRSLLNRDLKPAISVIETLDGAADWEARERYWIAEYRQAGANLTNVTDGGGGLSGFRHTDETRAKIGLIHKGKTISKVQRQKQSAAMQGKVFSDSHRQKLSEAGRGRVLTDATKRAISAARRGVTIVKLTGEGNGRAKLTKQQAAEIFIFGSSMSLRQIALLYGISKSQAARVRKGTQWK